MTVTLSYCIVHAYVDVDDDEVYGSVVTYMYIWSSIQIHIICDFFRKRPLCGKVQSYVYIINLLSLIIIYILHWFLNDSDKLLIDFFAKICIKYLIYWKFLVNAGSFETKKLNNREHGITKMML